MKYEVNNEDTLLELAYQYDNISFDIFDTLIMRKTLFPEDVFQIIEKKVCGKSDRFATFRKEQFLKMILLIQTFMKFMKSMLNLQEYQLM